MAWLRPNDPHAQAGAISVGRADALVEGCAVPVPVAAAAATAASAAVSTVALSKGRAYVWSVDMRTDPDMTNDTYEAGDSLDVFTTWQQEVASQWIWAVWAALGMARAESAGSHRVKLL